MTDDFGQSYKQTLGDFIETSGEEGLERAYSLGRQALNRGLSLGAVGEVHYDAMRGVIADQKIALETLNRSEAFFLEISSVYDMALRGYRESMARLQAEIEERKEIEKDLRDATFELSRQRDLLETRVEERTRELKAQAVVLQRANEELTRSNRDLDDFAYIASHDLKEPLRASHNHAKFLIEDYADRLEDEGLKRLNRIIKLCQRMEQLIADLFYYSRLGRGHQTAENLDLNTVIADVGTSLAETLKQQNARISADPKLPTIVGHPAHIGALFQNLILNGVKYNDAKDKVVEVGVDKDHAGKSADRVVIFVRDNGIGIGDAFHDQIFSIFKRLNSEKAYGEGTGAGLTFVKRIVENHEGQIWLESTPGEGTTFYVTLEKAD